MPKLSLKSVVLRAIHAAVEDRQSLADCYQSDSDGHEEALAEAAAVRELEKSLTGLPRRAKVPAQHDEMCFSVLVWAAQWEDGVADALHRKGNVAKASMSASKLYRETRLQRYGPSKLENFLATAKSMPLQEANKLLPANAPAAKATPQN